MHKQICAGLPEELLCDNIEMSLTVEFEIQKQYRKSVCEILNGVEGETLDCGGLFVSCVNPAVITGIVHIC